MPVSLSDFSPLREFVLQELEFTQFARSRDSPLSIGAMQAVSSWSLIDEAMLELFVWLSQRNRHRAAVAFKSAACFRTKCSMIAAAAKNAESATRFGTLEKLLSVALKAKRRRNRLEDWTWGYSDTFPNALLLIKPSGDVSCDLSIRDVFVYQDYELANIVREHARIADCLGLYQKITTVEGNPVEGRQRLMEPLGI